MSEFAGDVMAWGIKSYFFLPLYLPLFALFCFVLCEPLVKYPTYTLITEAALSTMHGHVWALH